MDQLIRIELTPAEMRYIIRCGAALAQNVPEHSLPTYCGFNKGEINQFSQRMRDRLDDAGLDM